MLRRIQASTSGSADRGALLNAINSLLGIPTSQKAALHISDPTRQLHGAGEGLGRGFSLLHRCFEAVWREGGTRMTRLQRWGRYWEMITWGFQNEMKIPQRFNPIKRSCSAELNNVTGTDSLLKLSGCWIN